jgi:LCP family protein required for cell wall assembly
VRDTGLTVEGKFTVPSALPNTAEQVQVRRAVGFVLMSALVPGSVQSFAGNQRVGRVALRVFGGVAALLLLIVIGLLAFRSFTVGLLLTPLVAATLRVLVWVLFVGWLLLLLDAWRLARPLRLERKPRLGLTVLALASAVIAGLITSVAASAFTGAANLGEVLSGGGDTKAKDGRYNVLLLGADAAAHREGLRPDSINVASVDAATGRTVLFGLPRNMQRVPFPESSPLRTLYPDGYVCDDGECMLNGIYTLGEEHADLYPGQEAGLAAIKEAVSETLGLELNYYAMVDMGGFEALIDAMGGIRLDIAKPIPIGGVSTKIKGYIEPGTNVLLDGYHALWFARSRAESSDYERMVRQKCVMSAMAQQLDPMTVATKFGELSEAGGDLLRTDVGRGEAYELAELALKAKGLKVSSVNFAPPLIVSAHPDFALIRETVQKKIAQSEAKDEDKSDAKDKSEDKGDEKKGSGSAAPTTKPSATQEPAPSTTSPAPTGSTSQAPQEPYTETEDLDAVCTVSG